MTKRMVTAFLVVLVLLPLLAGLAEADVRRGGGGHAGWSRAGWRQGGGGRGYYGGGGFFLGLGVGALLTAPYWYPPSYSYPVYAPAYPYPAYPYPAYPYPAYGSPTYSPTYTGPSYAPSPQAPAAGPAESQVTVQGCETVTVEGHYETRVMPTGERLTAWIPAHTEQVCR